MTDIFVVTLTIPASDSLFRKAVMVIRTPTGSVEVEKYPGKTWRDLDNEVAIRNFVEARLINIFPARRAKWHGSRVGFYGESSAGITAVVSVESDHYDGSDPSQYSSFTDG